MLEPKMHPKRPTQVPPREALKRKERTDFSDFSIGALDWKPTRTLHKDNRYASVTDIKAEKELQYQGRAVTLNARRSRKIPEKTPGNFRSVDEYSFELGTGNARVTESVSIEDSYYDSVSVSASTEILKNDPKKELPEGIGRELYLKVLDFLQTIANTQGKNVIHYVKRYPGWKSTTAMSAERWDALFLPILHAAGYSEAGVEGVWSKTYCPNSAKAAPPERE